VDDDHPVRAIDDDQVAVADNRGDIVEADHRRDLVGSRDDRVGPRVVEARAPLRRSLACGFFIRLLPSMSKSSQVNW